MRVDVLEGEDLIVLVLDIGGCLAGYDAAEYAVGAHGSPCVGVYSFPAVARVGDDSERPEEKNDGYLSRVQAANPPERQSRQARLGLDAQDVSGQAARAAKPAHAAKRA